FNRSHNTCGVRGFMKTPYCTIAILIGLISFLIITPSSRSQTDVLPSQALRTRLQPIIHGILAAWDKFDVVCLGEDHGSKNDSDLRITLVEHPDFIRKVNVVMIEFADSAQQKILDRFALDGEEMFGDQLQQVWGGSNGKPVGD